MPEVKGVEMTDDEWRVDGLRFIRGKEEGTADVTMALLTIFSAFYQFQGVDNTALARAMIAWLEASSSKDQYPLGGRILKLVWSAPNKSGVSVEFDSSRVVLHVDDVRIFLTSDTYRWWVGANCFPSYMSPSRQAKIYIRAMHRDITFEPYMNAENLPISTHVSEETFAKLAPLEFRDAMEPLRSQ